MAAELVAELPAEAAETLPLTPPHVPAAPRPPTAVSPRPRSPAAASPRPRPRPRPPGAASPRPRPRPRPPIPAASVGAGGQAAAILEADGGAEGAELAEPASSAARLPFAVPFAPAMTRELLVLIIASGSPWCRSRRLSAPHFWPSSDANQAAAARLHHLLLCVLAVAGMSRAVASSERTIAKQQNTSSAQF